jgi:hypothetical protein
MTGMPAPSAEMADLVQTGVCNPGIDTSDTRQGLCHSGKSFDCCCISGSETGILLS